MPAITLAARDLAETRRQLTAWFAKRFGEPAELSELEAANRASGWSSESLRFTASRTDGARAEYVVRIPPTGGGIFPSYDLGAQTRTQEVLRAHGIPTPSPLYFEPDAAWIGAPFLVMPRIVGHIPSDTTYATRGWLHGAGPDVQRRVHDGFLDTLVGLQRVPRTEAGWLARPTGTGTAAEMDWWHEYVRWGSDTHVPDVMVAGFEWLRRNQPDDPDDLVLCWGDARFSNAIYADDGTVVGVLDWEQACWGPAEFDFGWWLATRRQMLEVQGLDLDPELPGFDNRDTVIGRYADMIGRPLANLEWFEIFAMIRMACCMVRMQSLLRSIGQGDHGFAKAPLLPTWTLSAIGA